MRRPRLPIRGVGPRARRRLALLAATVAGLVVAAGLIYWLAAAGNSSTSGQQTQTIRASAEQQLGYGQMNLGVAYGTTPKQVRRQLGAPATTNGNCWTYRGSKVIPDAYRAFYSDAVRFCFSPGATGNNVVTQIFDHWMAHTIVETDPVTHVKSRKYFPAVWGPAFTLSNPATETLP